MSGLYEDYKVYGPYMRKDGRQQVCLVHKASGLKKTVSYPKYLMEISLGRNLLHSETVDHINGDFTDNRIENLQILDRGAHCALDVKRLKQQVTNCVFCGSEVVLTGRRLSTRLQNQKRGKVGPFCSRRCSGKYGKSLQEGAAMIKSAELEAEYTTLKQDGAFRGETTE